MDVTILFNAPPVFETERLILRKLEMSDAEEYFKLASDPLVFAETIWDRHRSIQDTVTYLTQINQKQIEHQAFHWGIIDKTNQVLIGRTGLISIDSVHEKAEIGYALSSEYWNKGIITESTKEIIQYCFLTSGMNRIEGRCNHNNLGSNRVMEKLGMKYEGTLRQQLKIKDRFIDQKLYSILKSEFACFHLEKDEFYRYP